MKPRNILPQLGHNRVATAVAIATLAAVGLVTGKAFEEQPGFESRPVPTTVPDSNNSQPLLDEHTTVGEALQTMQDDIVTSGEGVVIFRPTAAFRDYFRAQYLNDRGLPTENPPKLEEVMLFSDKDVFSSVERKNPNTFLVLNASERPVDIPFVRFVLKGTEYWLDSQPKGRVTIHNQITAKVTQDRIPHTFLLTDEVMKKIKDQTDPDIPDVNIKGATRSWSDHSISNVSVNDSYGVRTAGWRGFNFDNPALFYRYHAMATEICQALVSVHNPQVLPGALVQRKLTGSYPLLDEYGDLKDYDNKDEFSLRNQEVVCNGLGDTLAATYLAGKKGTDTLAAHPQPPTVRGFHRDYSLYANQLPAFRDIKKAGMLHPGYVNTPRGNSTPTTNYLRIITLNVTKNRVNFGGISK